MLKSTMKSPNTWWENSILKSLNAHADGGTWRMTSHQWDHNSM